MEIEEIDSSKRKDDRIVLLFTIILILAMVLRVIGLDRHGLSLDEANSVIVAQGSLHELLSGLVKDAHPPLYYLILCLWMKLFGGGEFAIRFFSLILGLILIIMLYRVGSSFFSPLVGLVAAFIATTNPMNIFYAQNARMYTILPLLGLLSILFLLRALEEGKISAWIGYSISSVAALYTHNYGLFILPIGWFLFLRKANYPKFKRFFLSQLAILFLYLPWLSVLLSQIQVGGHNWISRYMAPISPLFWIPKSLEVFSVGAGLPYYFKYLGFGAITELKWLSRILFGTLLVLGLLDSVTQDDDLNKRYALIIYLFFPLFIAFLLSISITPLYLIGRYDFVVFPAFCLLIGLGVSKIKNYSLLILVAIILLGLSVSTLKPYYQATPRRVAAVTADYLVHHARDGEFVVFTGYRRASTQYYLEKMDGRLNLLSFPLEVADHLGTYDEERYLEEPEKLNHDADQIIKMVGPSLSRGERLWVADSSVRAVNIYLYQKLKNFMFIPELSQKKLKILCFKLQQKKQ